MSEVWSWKGQRPASGWSSVFHRRVRWGDVDWSVVLLAAAMVFTSLLFVNQMAACDADYGRREPISFQGHVKKVVVALPFLVLGFFLRPRWLRKNAWLFYGGAMVLLFLVPVIGEERNNARRWIPMPLGFDLQPSELAKIGLILILGRTLYRNRLQRPSQWFVPAVLALLPMALVAVQPDLGTALTIVPVTLGMLWLAGARGTALTGIVTLGVLVALLAWRMEWIEGYQKKRIDTWIASFAPDDLIENRNGAAFHPYHARTAIGNGRLFGRGLGRGVANQAGHLPERESDSIFAVIAEEGGFVGAAILVSAYFLMSALLLAAAARKRERFSRLVIGGVGLYFAAHFFINASVNLGLVPMTGMTLPLISTGGSSLLASFLALGLALGLAARHDPAFDGDAFRY